MLLPPTADPASAPTVPVTLPLPRPLWEALQLCTPASGDVTAIIVEAVETYLARMAAQRGKPTRRAATLARPLTTLGLSTRAERALLGCGIRHVYALVTKTRQDLVPLKNFGPKSLQEVEQALAGLGLQLGMTLEATTYRAAVLHAHLAGRRSRNDEEEG